MNQGIYALAEVAVSSVTASAISDAVSMDNLTTALITLAISVVTVVGGELVKFMVKWIRSKEEDLDEQDKEDEQ